MTKGNFVVFKGETNSGKTRVAHSTIRQFLQPGDKTKKAVFVGLNKQSGDELLASLSEEQRKNCLSFGVDREEAVSDAEYYLAPFTALRAAIDNE